MLKSERTSNAGQGRGMAQNEACSLLFLTEGAYRHHSSEEEMTVSPATRKTIRLQTLPQ
jgi:hypothetical protein